MVENTLQEKAIDPTQARRRGRWKLFAVLLVCAAPMIASYLTYYVIKPSGRTNYGTLIDPRERPIPPMASTTLAGEPRRLEDLAGKWLMVKVGGADCAQACQKQLHAMRQWRLMQGKNMDRIQRVWLLTDAGAPDAAALRQVEGVDVLDGVQVLRADAATVQQWLPAEAGSGAADHIYLIDPLGNLMMRFPKEPEPRRVYQDIAKLLKASAIG